ncbi:MAG: nickel pincer cofactor biosynthesis protein LarB [Sphaerobacter sp.]|nr:nickel pincer cofactor biosynthesis protein LarB [Sphaerobacter sp.]
MRDGTRPSDRAFADLIRALVGTPPSDDGAVARVDGARAARTGVPEIIYAPGKSPEQVIAMVRELLRQAGRAVVSRAPTDLVARLRTALPDAEVTHEGDPGPAVVALPGTERPRTGGRVAILTAGTSDLAAAHEARVVALEMGCDVELVADVGVAGLHRLIGPLRRLLDRGVDVIVVAAGMDGALPSVVAGLVPVPVIGLPTSVGYGFGGGGQAALMSMLQTCAPGLTVVNIDNGVGAGAAAATIANAIARARRA